MHIAKYENGSIFNHEELRIRKLLVHKKEINKLTGIVTQRGYTIIPVEVYLNEQGRAKILIGVCKGKHSYDKRQSLKDKDIKRSIDRVLSSRR